MGSDGPVAVRGIITKTFTTRNSDVVQVKRTGIIPPEHVSHDHLNEQKDIPIDDTVFQKWKTRFEQIEQEHRTRGEQLKWVMVDGFLLYWHSVSCGPNR